MKTVTEGIRMTTAGVHHVALRCSDLSRARVFYVERLGFPLLMESDALFIFAAGNTAIAVRAPDAQTAASDRFDPFRIGLDHVALGCQDPAELRRVASALDESGIDNTGVKTDATLGKEYVAFKDPDGIAWELFMV